MAWDDRRFPARERNGVMYQDYFGIKENPFSLTPDPRYLYMAKGHQEALAHLFYGVSGAGGFVLLTGEVGTGKTTVCRCLLEELPAGAEVALILNPRLDEIELLASICDELGVKAPQTRSLKVLVDRLNAHFRELHAEGRHAILIVDEAQNLSSAVLEQIRLLTNLETDKRKLLQIILIGQPELVDLLDRKELRQLAQRISARYHLEPLNAAETKACLTHRLEVGGLDPQTFSPGACAEVYRRSGGLPRLINSLCDRCLLAAYVQETRRVDRKMVRAAAAEVFGWRKTARRRRRTILPWAVAAVSAAVAMTALIGPRDLWLAVGMPDISVVIEALEPREITAEKPATLNVETAEAKETSTKLKAAAIPVPDQPAPDQPAPNEQIVGESATGEVDVAAAATITLDQFFALDDVAGDEHSALVRLFARWRRDYDALPGRGACAKAHADGLECVSGKGDIQTLWALDRPALLPLDVPDGRQIRVVLIGLEGGWMTLEAGERQVRARAEEIAAVWTGRYLALWQPPAVYEYALMRGHRGADVAWLMGRLASLRGEPPDAAAEPVFDAALEAQVIAFQRSHALLVDGIVGARTLIQLSNAAGDPDAVRLAAEP